jgi:hypothetical protein
VLITLARASHTLLFVSGGLSLVVAAGTITKYKNESRALLEEIWNVLDPPHQIVDV